MPICANPECGREHGRPRSLYCSTACCKRVYWLTVEKKRRRRVKHISHCLFCGKEFIAPSNSNKFCTEECRCQAERQRYAEHIKALKRYADAVLSPMSDPYESPEFKREWKAACGDTHKSALRRPDRLLGF